MVVRAALSLKGAFCASLWAIADAELPCLCADHAEAMYVNLSALCLVVCTLEQVKLRLGLCLVVDPHFQ